MSEPKKHTGSCHCGAIRYEVEIDGTKGSRCNCTVCTRVGGTNDYVAPGKFRLLTPEEGTGKYPPDGKVAARYFCKTCGVSCYGRGHLEELGGDYVSVNLLTLEDIDPADLSVVYWDGRHDAWEKGPRATPWPVFTVAEA